MSKIFRQIFLLLVAVASILLIACSQVMQNYSYFQLSENHNSSPQKEITVESSISDDQTSAWRWQLNRLKSRESLTEIQVLSKTTARMVDSQGKLYETSDAGETWHQVAVKMPLNSDITSIFFANASLGWITATKSSDDVLDNQNTESWIFNTSDGGLTWNAQYSDKSLELQRVLFINDQEGWAIGSRLIKGETLQNNYFVIHTTDQGKHWTDVSSNLNSHKANGYVEGIYAVEPSQALVLTSNRKLFSTSNGGLDWQEVGNIENEPPQTAMLRMGVLQNKLPWILGATDGREGIWTTLALKRNNDSWTKYRIGGVYLSDITFLTDTQLIGCGSIATNNKPRLDGGVREGVILYSADSGLSWVVVYRNADVSGINALTVNNASQILAVGENGLVIHSEPPLPIQVFAKR